ncbi:hypothetical protein [Oceanobacillus sp. J11TS1]|uniref:hypothetical protein n=1 Tax=Oceanobacillus sp. J11TS1 TaxID=2807191 RepID=UPI001B06965A|nr:hypothetical protein [Oceanobacillus sp. J11TS1]GIO22025.1 hypothetical protein J11TS1_06060 [Oceanobacillus sp. J11TS1]
MDNANYIRYGLHLQGLSAYENDIPYIYNLLRTMKQAQISLDAFPHLNTEIPITIVDKELLL